MNLTLIIVAAIGVILFVERSVEHLKLALSALCFSAALLLFAVADFERAILLAAMLVAAVFAASSVKARQNANAVSTARLSNSA